MKKIFVSGCYDIIHAGHIEFFRSAKALGDHLTVCFASASVLMLAKNRVSALPDSHKAAIIGSIKYVDRAVPSSDNDAVLDFVSHWKEEAPDILAINEDDAHIEAKRHICRQFGVQLIVLQKNPPTGHTGEQISTTKIRQTINNIHEVPLRVDFAGGWLDVPRLAKKGAFIVNCAITPKVSLTEWSYEKGAGLGGSAAYSILQVRDGLKSEIALGVGWQDPAVIEETGLCVWRSGKQPVLEAKYNPDWLAGRMLIYWTGTAHNTPSLTGQKRDYRLISKAGTAAAAAVHKRDLRALARAVSMSYKAQLGESMSPLPTIAGAIGWKYLGGGHGGYALYLFPTKRSRDIAHRKTPGTKVIEPYIES
ncbi:MAG: adenylyltransferase/cytidyltransferase family protein [Patescibacteria group bacterium]|nr:adenylyltransferase/cytidyltransferase family protein [Patescibacteria group bacterium]MDE1967241.1 adenylyltransferase/cytidyltransferase family protein [Patescibacteria group bacterium]